MIAVDTNILVYSHREDSSFHKKAFSKLSELANGEKIWAIPWPCLHEFIAIVTHPRIYKPPTPIEEAIAQVECWLECPRLHLLGEDDDYWPLFKKIVLAGKISGPLIHDARIAAICQHHGIDRLWSVDRDFNRFGDLIIENPLMD